MWKLYQNEDSGIHSYKIGIDYIMVRFKPQSAEAYIYNHKVPGLYKVEKMKLLAKKNKGLSTYISQVIKDNFFEKFMLKPSSYQGAIS